jgi:niacin transporter
MRKNNHNYVMKLTSSGFLLAAGVVLPWMFHMFGISNFGQVFLPMHLSVFIAGVFLGKFYGMGIGFLTPLINSLFGMPMFPMNLIMAFELAAYGFFSGLFTADKGIPEIRVFGRKLKIYFGLLLSMIAGRIVYGLALFIAGNLLGMEKLPKPLSILAATVTGAPGIILQLVFVPAIVIALRKAVENR